MTFSTYDTARVRKFQRRVSILSAGGTFLDGFDLTVIAVALPLISAEWGVTPAEKSLIVSSAIIGSLIGASLLGNLTDRFGRKAMYVIDLLAFVVFAALTAFTQEVWQLILFRFLLGVGIGADYPISATLVSEFASDKRRGKHSTSLGAMWFVGAVAAYLTGLILAPLGDWSWRILLLVGALFALVVFIARVKLPESPRWLASKGRITEAQEVMVNITGDPRAADDSALTNPAAYHKSQGLQSFKLLFGRKLVKRTLFVCGFWFCYATAYYGISMYVPTILAPLTKGDSTLTIVGSGIVAVIGLLGALIGMNLVDHWGRRPLIITSFSGLFVALVVLALNSSPDLAFLVVLFSGAVLFANAGGGILNFVYPTELFPTSVRATASGFATSVSRVGSILGVLVFPNFVALWGNSVALWFFAAVALVGTLICVLMAPETKGESLESINREFYDANA